MILQGLRINMQNLDAIFDTEFDKRETVVHERLRKVSAHDIAATKLRFSDCTCERYGLREGMTVEQLIRMGAGCCDHMINPGKGWVCGRLVALRRLYGH